MSHPDYDGAIKYARDRLRKQLPQFLHYHNLHHTFGEVIPAALLLAEQESVSNEENSLLYVAGAYHDIGWVIQGVNHESISVDICRQVLPGYGFSENQLTLMAGMIMATRLPQTPTDKLESILADADMYSLGGKNFWKRNEDLRYETTVLRGPVSDREWFRQQVEFLESHQYHTKYAREHQEPKKTKYIHQLIQYLSQNQPVKQPWDFPPMKAEA
jgi:uncharacterized protein